MMIAFHTARGAASQPWFWPQYWKTVSLQFNPRYLPEYDVLMKYAARQRRILDIGCGRGLLVRHLLDRGYDIRGVDFDADSIFDSIRENGPFPSEVADLNRLPYRDNSFDVVLLAGTIEHVFEGPARGFAETFRVLRPGGFLVLTIPYLNLVRKIVLPFYVLRDWAFSWFPEQRKKRFFEYVFTRAAVVGLLTEAGFHVNDCRRAYYTTVLRKIPGFMAFSALLFGRPAAPAAHPGPSSRSIKRTVKRALEGALNRIIPNRLIVVARRPDLPR